VSDYNEKVKAAVCKLLDHVAESKWRTLDLDTDEECPMVRVWIWPNSIKAYGHCVEEKGTLCPASSDESWSFLDCCERVLAEIERVKVSE
jgi:hypothetical protein